MLVMVMVFGRIWGFRSVFIVCTAFPPWALPAKEGLLARLQATQTTASRFPGSQSVTQQVTGAPIGRAGTGYLAVCSMGLRSDVVFPGGGVPQDTPGALPDRGS